LGKDGRILTLGLSELDEMSQGGKNGRFVMSRGSVTATLDIKYCDKIALDGPKLKWVDVSSCNKSSKF
jgi:hypothetical protein